MLFSLPFGFQNLTGLLPDSSFLRVGQAGNTADRTQGGFFHSCTSVRCSSVVSRSHRATWPDPRSCGRFPSPPLMLRFQNLSTSGVEKQGSLRKPASREEGLPPRRKAEAAARGEAADGLGRPRPPTRPPGSGRPGELPRCPLDRRREGHPRPKYLRLPAGRRRRRCCYRTAPSASGTSSSGGH